MSTKVKKTKVRVIDEMPTFKRTTRIGVSMAKVEKKKMHTNTKPTIKKEKPKAVNRNTMRIIEGGINNIGATQDIIISKYLKFMNAVDKFCLSNNKENTKSVIYNADNIIKSCDKLQATLDKIKAGCNKIKESVK